MNTALSFDDITLIPQYSSLRSRSEADTSCEIWEHTLKTPLISSNMETITNSHMAIAMFKLGALGALHRFWSIQDNVREYQLVKESECDCLVSVGVKEEERRRTDELFQAGARMFIIDVAHFHSVYGEEMIKWMRDKYSGSIFIIAGNVATAEAVFDVEGWGADMIKVGIGNGSPCTTRKITGHGLPAVSTLLECSFVSKVPLILDGGIRDSGDLCKALVLGADFAMCGSLFAGTTEAAGLADWDRGLKLYKGSSTYEKPGIAKEGIETWVPMKGSVKNIIENITAGLRSGMSYANSRTLSELKKNGKWRQQTVSSELEGRPHILQKRDF